MSSHFCKSCQSVLELYHKPIPQGQKEGWVSSSFRIYTSHSFEETANNEQCRLCILILSMHSAKSIKIMREQDLEDRFEQGYDRKYKTYFYLYSWGDDGDDRGLNLARAWGSEDDGMILPDSKVKWDYKELKMISSKIPGFPSERPPADNTGHALSLASVKTWLDQGCTNHASCQPHISVETRLPTRLIYVGEQNQAALRLGKDIPHGTKYTTLSHRWGSDISIRLLSSNIDSLMISLTEKQLPRKFLDAIEISRYVGLEYLWIDSLCIVQDSVADWLAESSRMGQIYLHAHINIAGATGTPNGEGLFNSRDNRFIEPCIVEYDSSSPLLNRSLAIVDDGIWFWAIEASPLNRRGWVCQERLLSRRTIHFTKNQLFWECHSSVACELFPGGLPKYLYDSQPKRLSLQWQDRCENDPDREALQEREYYRAYNVWAKVISVYTFSNLTVPTDKLIAISALAWYWQTLVGGKIQYLAGLWRKNLAAQLLWKGFGGVYESITQEEWRAPSWSWASIEGPIAMPEMIQFDDERDILVEVRETSVELVSKDRFGSVKGGRITLCGRLAKIAVRSRMEDAIEVRGLRKPNYRMLVELDCRIDTRGVAFLNSDYEDGAWVEGLFCDLYFMPVRTTTNHDVVFRHPGAVVAVEGLILQRVKGNRDVFMRWGMGEMDESEDGTIFEEAFREFDLFAQQSGLEHKTVGEEGVVHYKVDII